MSENNSILLQADTAYKCPVRVGQVTERSFYRQLPHPIGSITGLCLQGCFEMTLTRDEFSIFSLQQPQGCLWGNIARKTPMLIVTQYTRKGVSHHCGLHVIPCCWTRSLCLIFWANKMFWMLSRHDYGGKVLPRSSSLLTAAGADGT